MVHGGIFGLGPIYASAVLVDVKLISWFMACFMLGSNAIDANAFEARSTSKIVVITVRKLLFILIPPLVLQNVK